MDTGQEIVRSPVVGEGSESEVWRKKVKRRENDKTR